MGAQTGIEWTDATWNPILGCSRVSEGCRNCYAEKIAARFGGEGSGTVYEGLAQIVNGHPAWTGKIVETRQLLQPLSWRRPKRVFVNSMSDPFHENVTDEQIDRIFAVMALCPQHTFQVLTKRPERMLSYLRQCARPLGRQSALRAALDGMAASVSASEIELLEARVRISGSIGPVIQNWRPLPNVWLGVSVENQAAADERIPLLLRTPAAMRFLSCEPLLGPINLPWASAVSQDVRLGGINWVIVGGESGPHARPMHPDWARSLRDQCVRWSVPFFFKQWGEWLPGLQYEDIHRAADPDEAQSKFACMDWDDELVKWFKTGGGWADDLGENAVFRVGKKLAGHMLDGQEWKQFPEASA